MKVESLLRREDREFYERELASFVPDRVFDAHAHLYARRPGTAPAELPDSVGASEYRALIDGLHPGRDLGALFLAMPWKGADTAITINEWVARHVKEDARFRGSFFVKTDDDPEWVRQEVHRLGLTGLKCYHTTALVSPTWEADIPAYLPERLVKVADEEGWTITLHMVKSRAVADESNIDWIRHYCHTYPNAKIILAHSARGFQPAHNLEGLPKLTGLNNLYFDSSANCEPMAHLAILRTFGHERLLYGSDFFVSHLRGRSLGAGDSFVWLYEDVPVWGEKHLRVRPVLVGLEHLRSLKWACWAAKLTDAQVEDVFWNNAATLFGIS